MLTFKIRPLLEDLSFKQSAGTDFLLKVNSPVNPWKTKQILIYGSYILQYCLYTSWPIDSFSRTNWGILCPFFELFWRGSHSSLPKLNYLLQVCGMYYMLLVIYNIIPNSSPAWATRLETGIENCNDSIFISVSL